MGKKELQELAEEAILEDLKKVGVLESEKNVAEIRHFFIEALMTCSKNDDDKYYAILEKIADAVDYDSIIKQIGDLHD